MWNVPIVLQCILVSRLAGSISFRFEMVLKDWLQPLKLLRLTFNPNSHHFVPDNLSILQLTILQSSTLQSYTHPSTSP
jgi:hypothetical protein